MIAKLSPERQDEYEAHLSAAKPTDIQFAWDLFAMVTDREHFCSVYTAKGHARPGPLYLQLALRLRNDEDARRKVRVFMNATEQPQ